MKHYNKIYDIKIMRLNDFNCWTQLRRSRLKGGTGQIHHFNGGGQVTDTYFLY